MSGDPADPKSEPSVADLGEFGLIARVTRGRVQPASTLLGPGDDAALVAAGDRRVAVSTDLLVEGVHFRLDWSTPEQVGRKAAAVNLADVAAMGAVPTALLVGLGCPGGTPAAVADGLAAGLWAVAGAHGAGVVGGDVVSAPSIVVAVTVLGDLQGRAPVTRSGARPGDVLALAGRLGLAAAGLAALSSGVEAPGEVLQGHRVPSPPYAAGPAASDAGATAMIDVSDGLLADLGHIARASGVAIDVRSAALPRPPALLRFAEAMRQDPLRWLLTGGEDHALVATFPPGAPLPCGWIPIGSVRDGAAVTVDGQPHGGPPGWDHFTGRK
ncbi:MAG TPA: thiamine-phosphate kinase [Pseudonocardia sp.]|uniref:thiamine-phosphate kinase n=1 Tax=Pseudonocardia sp. TaxID=60912 RepID=UPI002F415C97